MAATATKKKATAKNSAPTITLPVVRSATTTTDWATALLKAIKAPVTANNVNNIKLWMASEEPADAWLGGNGNDHLNNPLNTTWGGASSYKTIADGLSATANTINQSNMANILSALKSNAPTAVFKAAVVQSPWAGGHYSTVVNGKNTLDGAHFSSTPLNAYATSSGGDPTGLLGQVLHSGSFTTTIQALVPGSALLGSNPVSTVTTGVKDVTSSLSGLAKIESELTSATFWKRVGVFVLGAGLVVGGVILFTVTSKTGTKTIDTAAKVV